MIRPAILAAALAGCTVMDQHSAPPSDWPALVVHEHAVSCTAMVAKCYQYLSLPMKLMGGLPLGCAEIRFDQGRCDIYTCWMSPADVLAHERLHCRGYDHIGDSTLRDAFQHYKGGK